MTHVVLDDIGPARGTIVQIGVPQPVKGERAWHRWHDGEEIASW